MRCLRQQVFQKQAWCVGVLAGAGGLRQLFVPSGKGCPVGNVCCWWQAAGGKKAWRTARFACLQVVADFLQSNYGLCRRKAGKGLKLPLQCCTG